MSEIVRGDLLQFFNGATIPSGSTVTRLLGPYEMLGYPHKSFTIYNLGPVTLSGAAIRINPDHRGVQTGTQMGQIGGSVAGPNEGLWENYDTTTFLNLPAGSVKSAHITTATARWWEVVVINDRTPTITCSGWVRGVSV
jgi:hypothetical protein